MMKIYKSVITTIDATISFTYSAEKPSFNVDKTKRIHAHHKWVTGQAWASHRLAKWGHVDLVLTVDWICRA